MKIIFLDIDGVLNSERWLMSLGEAWNRTHIDPAAVAVLNQVVRATDAVVVISSTWRKMHTKAAIRGFLKDAGFTGTVIGITPDFNKLARYERPTKDGSFVRGDEIAEWLKDRPDIESFVILDDDSDMGALKHKLVQTTSTDGLLMAHLPLILSQLRQVLVKKVSETIS